MSNVLDEEGLVVLDRRRLSYHLDIQHTISIGDFHLEMSARAHNNKGTEMSLVRRYSSEEQARDDLRELLAEVDDHFSNLDRAIHDAGAYRIFFLTLRFLRDATLPGYTFIMEWDKNKRLWAVGYKLKNRRDRKKKDILIHDAKIDVAINLLLEVWKTWMENEKAGKDK